MHDTLHKTTLDQSFYQNRRGSWPAGGGMPPLVIDSCRKSSSRVTGPPPEPLGVTFRIIEKYSVQMR